MKIGHHHADKPAATSAAQTATPSSASTADAAKAQAQASVAATPATPDASAKIQLSSTATKLLANESNAEFDSAKVDRVSKAIADGSFKVHPEVIADKLIANAQELLSKVQR